MSEKKESTSPLEVSQAESVEVPITAAVETQGFDEHATKRLLRKLDWHIIPFMSLIYLCVHFLFAVAAA